jgi:hypothetical protein
VRAAATWVVIIAESAAALAAWALAEEILAGYKLAEVLMERLGQLEVSEVDPAILLGHLPVGRGWDGASETASTGAEGTRPTTVVQVGADLVGPTAGKIASMTAFDRPCLPSKCCR